MLIRNKFRPGSFKTSRDQKEVPGYLQEPSNILSDMWIFWYDECIMNE